MGSISSAYVDGQFHELTAQDMEKIMKATKLLKIKVGDFFEDDHILSVNFTATFLINGRATKFELADWWCGTDVRDYYRAECGKGLAKLLKRIKTNIQEELDDQPVGSDPTDLQGFG